MRALRYRLPLAGVLALCVWVAAAGAQDAKPAPGCAGILGEDPKGDQGVGNPSNLDITAFWIDTVGSKTSAYIKIADLNDTIPPDATGINWYVNWTIGEELHFIQGQKEVGDSAVTFSFGTTANNIRQQAGDTSGKLFPGADGIIKIDVPSGSGGRKGAKLESIVSDTSKSRGVPGVASSLATVDEVEAKSSTFTVAGCGSDPATPPPTATPGPGSPRQVTAPGKLDVKVGKPPRAKKVKKSLSLKLTSSGEVKNIEAALYKGKPTKKNTVGKGTLASLNKKGTLKLKISKKMKKGTYRLYLVGTHADGTNADRYYNLKFK